MWEGARAQARSSEHTQCPYYSCKLSHWYGRPLDSQKVFVLWMDSDWAPCCTEATPQAIRKDPKEYAAPACNHWFCRPN